jgi:hypothetical protein
MIRPEIVLSTSGARATLVIDDRATMHRAHGDYGQTEPGAVADHRRGDRPRRPCRATLLAPSTAGSTYRKYASPVSSTASQLDPTSSLWLRFSDRL